MTRCSTFTELFISRLFAAFLAISFAVSSLLSVTHQADFDMHAFETPYVLEAIEEGDLSDMPDNSDMDSLFCLAGLLCHAPVALFLSAESAVVASYSTELMRPESGMLRNGQTPDVLIPPPLWSRA